ncbi:bifunctional DedA family/phosphatase PAP2 family protein [Paraburkholderia sp. BL21I4N1]|uniref:bifunctional DedA family/phosphatase PAP2 family protein n=1 Tax=Paraburkholderia sp. BL21I4N1 TaxID=1938801 RepID=UPI000CFD0FD8|nr:bifunctional DedA family/phosphatase PAP2 family protein [Paraburkholderia sp. BL21I4N1]PQV44201.1 membrane protein DedA with SNARE-associated domain [Paraburkholderia sp. BL21I4N1]
MEHAYFHMLHLLAGHPVWTLTVIFLAAFLEAIAVVGTFIPGSSAIFVAGALVGTGTLGLGWVFACTITGAVAGDGFSYWLGRRYRTRISRLLPFRAHPQLLDAGYVFFARHGAKSVVLARFIGPVRAIVPVVAGMAGMTPARFYGVNVLSALLWASAYILLGVVFGASVQLVSGVSFRLVVTITLVVSIVWLGFRGARFLLAHINAWGGAMRHGLLNWAGAHRTQPGRFVLRALDPERPVAGFMVVTSAVVLFSAWVFFDVLDEAIHGNPKVGIDVSVYHFLQSMRTTWGDITLSGLATLGSIATLAALAVTVALWMIWERRWRTLAYWLGAVAFSQLLIFAIHLAIRRTPPGSLQSDVHVFPSTHVAAAVIIYGFLAFLLTRRVGSLAGVFVATVSAVVVLFIALAGLYFGQFWFSDAIGGAALAAVWISVVALTAVWRHPRVPPSRRLMPALMLGVVCVSVAVQLAFAPPVPRLSGNATQTLMLTTVSHWINSLSNKLPCYRADMSGDRREPMAFQWSANADDIRSGLRSRTWIEGISVSARSLLSVVSPEAAAIALPVLPKLNDGVPSPLVFVRPGNARDERDVLRFWPSGYAVQNERGTAPVPIWVGSLEHERLNRQSWPLNILRAKNAAAPELDAGDAWPESSGAEVLTRLDCRGTPVLLLISPAN